MFQGTDAWHLSFCVFDRSSRVLYFCIIRSMFRADETADSTPVLQGPEAVLVDQDSGNVLYDFNSAVHRDPSSLSDLMTVYLAASSLNQNQSLTMSETASATYDHSNGVLWIETGETLSALDCMAATLLAGANDTAAMLAEGVSGSNEAFLTAMNTQVEDWNLADTHFDNLVGLSSDNNYSSAADIADVDYVLVCAKAPSNADPRASQDADGNYIPLSLQYRPYTADSEYVRQTSIAGDPADGSKWAEHDSAEGVEIENRSYYGRTSMITNEGQLDQILDAAKLAKEVGKPCIVILDITQPMCVYEFESEVDAILVSMSGSTEAACKIVAGQSEPSGLLPMQMPKDMDTVEKQLEDVPRDMDCYVDADGNEYDFAFGLNYSGKISDDRTKKYYVDPLTKPEA